jgi:hypothetical protein
MGGLGYRLLAISFLLLFSFRPLQVEQNRKEETNSYQPIASSPVFIPTGWKILTDIPFEDSRSLWWDFRMIQIG